MRRTILILTLLVASPARGQTPTPTPMPTPVVPKAVVVSPAGDSVPAGYPVMVDATASVMDANQPLQWQVVRPPGLVVGTFDKGPRQGVAALIATLPKQEMSYTIAVTAVAVDPGTHDVRVNTAVIDIHAEYAPPAPTPTPVPPAPNPGPPAPPPVPSPVGPVSDAYETGRKFASILGSTYGDAWDAAATALEKGRTVSECQKILQKTWKDARTREFTARITPVFQALLPEGDEPKDPAKRAAVVQMWRDLARGLRGEGTQ